HCRWGLTRAEQRGRIPSLDLLFMFLVMQPRTRLASGLQVHIGGSCPAFHAPVSPGPSCPGCSQSLRPPACRGRRRGRSWAAREAAEQHTVSLQAQKRRLGKGGSAPVRRRARL
ncbi:unnamed protein product, partial [Bubo scandiacus]